MSQHSRSGTPSGQAGQALQDASFYPYDAIVEKWEKYLVWKGVAKTYAKKFLSGVALIARSSEARDHPIWGVNHVFYKCLDAKTGDLGLYFIESDVTSLLSIILLKHPSLDRATLSPNPKRKVHFSDFTIVEAITFKTVEELHSFKLKQIPSANVNLLRINQKKYADFERHKNGTVLAIDVESYERNHSLILEIGWSSIGFSKCPKTGGTVESRSSEHIVIADNTHCRNGSFTPDNRHKFNFGKSEEITLSRTISRLSNLIDTYRKAGPLFLVFHNASAEIAYFSNLGIETKEWVAGLPDPAFWNDPPPEEEPSDVYDVPMRDGIVYIMDTQPLFGASGHPDARKQIGLKNALDALEIPHRNLHNAGNDACYTLAVYEAIVGQGCLKEDLIAEDKARLTKIKLKSRDGWYSGWD